MQIIILSLSLLFTIAVPLAIIYLSWLCVNALLLVKVVPSGIIFAQAVKNTNLQIQSFINNYTLQNEGNQVDDYSKFYVQLVNDAPRLGFENLNCSTFQNGVQRENITFYIWLSNYPDEKVLEAWKTQLRQVVRTYNNNLDVLFNKIEEGPFLKLKLNLVTREQLNYIQNAKYKELYSEKGEI